MGASSTFPVIPETNNLKFSVQEYWCRMRPLERCLEVQSEFDLLHHLRPLLPLWDLQLGLMSL